MVDLRPHSKVGIPTMHKVLSALYYNPSHPAGYAGAKKLWTHAKQQVKSLQLNHVKTWLKQQKTYTLHKPIRRRFPRRHTIVAGIDQQWQADLADLQSLSKHNDQARYLLCILDVFSRYAWVVPLKDKKGSTLVKAFDRVFQERQPLSLQTDKGSEFKNVTFQSFLKKQGIHYFTTDNPETKASLVERFQRTLKTRMWKFFTHRQTRRYVDDLPSMVHAYNHSVHRSIQTKPALVNEDNEVLISSRSTLKPKRTHIQVGDLVRINKTKRTFDKGYLPNWTTELFKVTKVNMTRPTTFSIQDLAGEHIEGTFYDSEIQVIKDDHIYEIESVLDRRTTRKGGKTLREIKVHWKGYPKKFDSWIPEQDLV